jgi:diguanylate cyclase (GGDEF)-like protein
MMHRELATPSPSLHRTWMTAVMRVATLMFVLAVVVLAATEFQRQMFARTTEAVESEMGDAITLKNAHLHLNETAGGVIYRYGGAAEVPAAEVAYDEASATMAAALTRAEKTFDQPETALLIASTRDSWTAFSEAMNGARDRSPSEIKRDVDALSRGTDPFAQSVWAPLAGLDRSISQLGTHNINDLRARSINAARAQRIVVPVVIATLALGVWLIWRAGRRLNRRVISPLMALRASATAIHDPSAAGAGIDLRGTTVELEELAQAMNDAALNLRSSNGALKHQAETDGLTGLHNRRSFLEKLDAMIRLDEVTAVLFIDLDDFKLANDALGHAAGDEVLRTLAQRLAACVRTTDVLARFGGDEFTLAVGRTAGASVAAEIAQRVITTMGRPVSFDGTPIQLGCSIGISVVDSEVEIDADELVRNADSAMYLAKTGGKNRFEFFAPAMRSELLSRTRLSSDLRVALRLNQLEVYYQPAVDLESEELLGYEALLRWHHPTRGEVPPNDFIPLAESTGDIVAIGRWVLDQACQFLARERAGPAPRLSPWVSVNVSPLQIDPDFVATVLTTLRRHAVPPDALILEITEDVAVTNTAAATAVLAELRGHGVRVALDDFGTGFSSLRYLHELPVDFLKIDRSFVTRIGPQTDVLLEAITALAGRLGLSLIAEGVEKPSEASRLLAFGPMAAQGYLYARPMPARQALGFGHPGHISAQSR